MRAPGDLRFDVKRFGMKTLLSGFEQDVRFGIRTLSESAGFTATAVCSLALGIAATTAIFSVIYGVVVDPFPYAHPETLMSIEAWEPQHRGVFRPFTPDHYLDVAEHNHVFQEVAAATTSDVLLSGNRSPERLSGNFTTTNAFEVMGVGPYLGRYIGPLDGGPEAAPVVVLGYKFWQQHFGGDRHVLGTKLRLNDKVRTVVGVMPPRFMWQGADVYLPIVYQRGKVVEGVRYLRVTARLKPGVTAAEADADLHPAIRAMLERDPTYRGEKFNVVLQNFFETHPSRIRKQLWILFSAVSVLLLIACTNVSNLMLARGAARNREMVVRASLGAGRVRIARQLLTESLLIGLTAALVGALLAFGVLHAVVAMIPAGTIPDEARISLNVPVLLFTLAISLLTALLFGLAPAIQSGRTDLAGALRSSGRGLAGSRHEGRLRHILVGAEVALAIILLVGASLVIRTLLKLQDIKLGYEPSKVLSVQIPLTEGRYPSAEARNRFLSTLITRVQSLPGVEQIGMNTFVHPFANWGMSIEATGSTVHDETPVILSQTNSGYQSILHIPLRRGRFFDDQDTDLRRHVAVVNERLAQIYYQSDDVLGRVIRLPQLKGEPIKLADDAFTIIGVTGDIKNVGLKSQNDPEVYVPYTVTGYLETFIHPLLLITAHIPPQNLARAVEQRIHSVDPDQPVMQMETVQKLLDEDDEGFAEPRFSVFLFSVFAALGLALSALGIYGVMNYSVSRQIPSLSVRMALGAQQSNIVRLVLKEALHLLLTGTLAGVVCGLAVTRWLSSLLWGVSPTDPLSFAAVSMLLLAVGFAACLRPTWRACRVDPAAVLRYE